MSAKMLNQMLCQPLQGLKCLQDEYRDYTAIVSLLETISKQKNEQIEKMSKQMNEYIMKSQGVIAQLDNLLQIKSNKNQQQKTINHQQKTPPKRTYQKMNTNKRTRQEQVSQQQQSQVKKISDNRNKDRVKIKQTRVYNKSILQYICNHNHLKFKSGYPLLFRLKRNPNVCQLHFRFESYYKDGKSNFLRIRDVSKVFCSDCNQWIEQGKASTYCRTHFFLFHNKKLDRHAFKQQQKQICQLYNEYKEKLVNKQLTIYKCNCNKQLLGSQQQYINHMKIKHNGIVPPYSSHLLEMSENGKYGKYGNYGNDGNDGNNFVLFQNQSYQQLLVLEDYVDCDQYYCGVCDSRFYTHSGQYVKHLLQRHQGQACDTSSHFILTFQEEIQQFKHLITPQILQAYHADNTKINKHSDNKPQCLKSMRQLDSKPQSLKQPKNKPLCLKSMQPSENKSQCLKQPKNKPQYVNSMQHSDNNPTYLNSMQQLHPDQKKFQKILSLYKGPYNCLTCGIKFSCYNQMSCHHLTKHEDSPQPFKNKSNFLKIVVGTQIQLKAMKKRKQLHKYYLPKILNRNDPIGDIQLDVPLKKNIGIVRMNYREFVKFVQRQYCTYANYYTWVLRY